MLATTYKHPLLAMEVAMACFGHHIILRLSIINRIACMTIMLIMGETIVQYMYLYTSTFCQGMM